MQAGMIDYGMGNLRSVQWALEHLGVAVRPLRTADDCDVDPDVLVLPGVGAFPRAIDELRLRGLYAYVAEWVAAERPLLGICLGFQLLFGASEEHGGAEGFGFFEGTVRRLDAPALKIPQIGWNDVRSSGALDFADGHYYYFVHSYAAPASVPDADVATAEYGQAFAAAACRGRIWGAQFHPERSGRRGLEFLQTFLERVR